MLNSQNITENVETKDIENILLSKANNKPHRVQLGHIDYNKLSEKVFYNRKGKAYAGYNIEALKAMANNGDVAAIKELAYRYITAPPKPPQPSSPSATNHYLTEIKKWAKEKQKYIDLAIIYGDIELLEFKRHSLATNESLNILDPEQAKVATLNDLAVDEFISMRGAAHIKHYNSPITIAIYENQHGPLTLSENDKSYIYQKAEEIYDDYETRRLELGLGPFEPHKQSGVYDPNHDLVYYLNQMGENAY